jgi:hypothetical protein
MVLCDLPILFPFETLSLQFKSIVLEPLGQKQAHAILSTRNDHHHFYSYSNRCMIEPTMVPQMMDGVTKEVRENLVVLSIRSTRMIFPARPWPALTKILRPVLM